jgi:hypothetical protein
MGLVAPAGVAPGAPAAAPAPIPALRPAPQPTGLQLEALGRERLRQMIGLRVTINAPTWNEILFSSKPIPVKVSPPPPTVLAAIDQIPPPIDPGAPPDAVEAEARQLLKGLSDARPRALPPRSIAGGRKLPPPADLVAKWLRRVFLVVSGPDAVRLMVASGYLLPSDVDLLEIVYPKGFDEERRAAVEAAITVAAAAHRNQVNDHDLPSWLNDQLLVLMDERRPSDFYAEIYAQDEKESEAKGPNPSAAAPDKIAQQTAPTPAVNR